MPKTWLCVKKFARCKSKFYCIKDCQKTECPFHKRFCNVLVEYLHTRKMNLKKISYYEHKSGDEFETRKENLRILTRSKINYRKFLQLCSSTLHIHRHSLTYISTFEMGPFEITGQNSTVVIWQRLFRFSSFSYSNFNWNCYMKSEKSDRFFLKIYDLFVG